MSIIYEALHPDTQLPVYATADAAGMDAYAYLKDRELTVHADGQFKIQADDPYCLMLWPGWRVAIPLGFKARLPQGWEMQVRSRSGLTLKQGLVVANAPGTIDADYPGEWAVILENRGRNAVEVCHGDRIAQLVLAPTHRLPWTAGVVTQTTDRSGGFGSTGT